jgi:hypothetical protein
MSVTQFSHQATGAYVGLDGGPSWPGGVVFIAIWENGDRGQAIYDARHILITRIKPCTLGPIIFVREYRINWHTTP